MAGPDDNTEVLQLSTTEARKSLAALLGDVEKLREKLMKSGNFKEAGWQKHLNEIRGSIKELGTITAGVGNAFATTGEKIGMAARAANRAVEQAGGVIGTQANQLRAAMRLVEAAAKTRLGTPFATDIKTAAEALKAYEAQFAKVRAKIVQSDLYPATSAKGAAARSQLQVEAMAAADLLNLRKKLTAEEKNATKEASAAAKTAQKDSNDNFAVRKAKRKAEMAEEAALRAANRQRVDQEVRGSQRAMAMTEERINQEIRGQLRAEAMVAERIDLEVKGTQRAMAMDAERLAQMLSGERRAIAMTQERIDLEVQGWKRADAMEKDAARLARKAAAPGATGETLTQKISRQAAAPGATGETLTQKISRQAATFGNYAILGAAFGGTAAIGNQIVKLDEALHNLQGITQTSDAGMGKLRDTILTTSAATKFLASDLADAATVLGQAGLSVTEIGQSLPAVATFAQATGIKLEESVNLLTSVMGAFNMRADETENLSNLFTAALNKSKLTVEQLSEGFQYSANSAAQLGISANELATTMALLANSGIKSGSMIGTGIRQILTQLSAPSKKLKDTLLDLHVPLDNIDIESHGLIQVMKNLRDAGFGASEAFQAFGTRGAAAFIALEGQLGDADKMQASITGTKAASEAAAIQMQSLANISKNAFAAFAALASRSFEPLVAVLKIVTSGLGDVFKAMGSVAPAVEVLGTAFALFAGAKIAQYIWGVSGLANAFNTLRNAVVAYRYIGFAALINPWAIAIAGLTAVLVGLTYVFGRNAEAAAKNAAALDEAQGKYDSTVKVYKNLQDETQNLLNKQNDLKDGTPALANETTRLGERFKTLGLDVRTLSGSYEELLGKMRDLRSQSLKEQELALGGLKSAQVAVLGDQTKEYGSQLFNIGKSRPGGTGSAVRDFYDSLYNGKGDATINATNQGTILNAAIEARKAAETNPALKRLADSLDKLYAQGQTVLATRGTIDGIGLSQQSVSKRQAPGFQSFQTNLETSLSNIQSTTNVKGGMKPRQEDDLARDSVAYAQAYQAYYKASVAILDKQTNALNDYAAKGGDIGKKTVEDSGDLQRIKDVRAKLDLDLETSNTASKAQRLQLAKNREQTTNLALQNAQAEFSATEDSASAHKAYQKILGLEATLYRSMADQKAAELGLRDDQYVNTGGQIKITGTGARVFDKETQDNIATFNADIGFRQAGSKQAYDKKISDFGKKDIKDDQANQLLVDHATETSAAFGASVTGKALAASIARYAKRATDAYTQLDNYSPISIVRAAAEKSQQALFDWYTSSMQVINDELAAQKTRIDADYQIEFAKLKNGGNPTEVAALKTLAAQKKVDAETAADSKRDTLYDTYGIKTQDNFGKRDDLLNKNTDRRVATWQDAWEGIQAAAAPDHKTKSGTNEWAQSFQDTVIGVVDVVKSQFGGMWTSIMDGSKSAGAAVKDFCKSILQSIMQTITNRLVQQFVGLLMNFIPGGASAPVGQTTGEEFHFSAQGGLMPAVGRVSGMMTTRDSVRTRLPAGSFVMRQSAARRLSVGGHVNAMLQPGEDVYNPAAVSMIGLNNLKRMNSEGNTRRFTDGGLVDGAALADKMGARARDLMGHPLPSAKGAMGKPHQTNVYVVAPDQKPQLGPNDVLAVLTNDIQKNGVTKKLIKSVMAGG